MKIQKIIILLVIPIAILRFTSEFPHGVYFEHGSPAYALSVGYLNDFAQPVGFYFGLCLLETWLPWLKPWRSKASVTFLAPALIEVGQLLYPLVFVSSAWGAFDPWDLLAYALGALLAAGLERQILARWLPFWENKA